MTRLAAPSPTFDVSPFLSEAHEIFVIFFLWGESFTRPLFLPQHPKPVHHNSHLLTGNKSLRLDTSFHVVQNLRHLLAGYKIFPHIVSGIAFDDAGFKSPLDAVWFSLWTKGWIYERT